MEDLLARQYVLMHNIEKLLVNFKKDGQERKTTPNIDRKINLLSLFWNEFNGNHTQLCDYQEINHPYFKDDFYTKTKNFYRAVLNYLQLYVLYIEAPESNEKPSAPTVEMLSNLEGFPKSEEIEKSASPFPFLKFNTGATAAGDRSPAPLPPRAAVPPPPATGATPIMQRDIRTDTRAGNENRMNTGLENKLEEKLRKQTSNFKAFSRTISNIDIDSLSEKWEFEDILKLIDSRWNAIDTLHWDIDSEQYEDAGYERIYTKHEKEYNNIKRTLSQKMWSTSYKTKTTPTMDIPTFHGDYHKWTSFKDLFEETIHKNRSMSNAQKMQFLKSKIKGESEKLIQHLNISSDNYQVCWDILNHRYNNIKLLFSSHVNLLMSLPVMQQQTAPLIKKIHDTTKECLNAIKNLGVDITTWDPLLVHILSQKLDAETHKDYIESLKSPRDLPSLSDFFEFLENKFTSLETSRRKQDSNVQKTGNYNTPSFGMKKSAQQQNNYNYNKHNKPQNNKYVSKSYHVSSAYKCLYCKGEHSIFFCDEFIKLPNEKKLKVTNDLRLCTNCLYDHKGDKCMSTKTCRKCTESHNTLLHDAFTKPSTSSTSKPSKENVNVSQNKSSEILLSTAQIKVQAADGSYLRMRALIDQGSQISLITENAAQKLGLPRRRCKGVVFGLGTQENSCKGAMNITASAIYGDFKFNANVMIMKNLINNLPNQTFQKPTWSHIENISLADPDFNVSRPIDILLGADIYALIMLSGIIKGDNESQPMAQQTHLGWLLCGNVKTYQCNVVLNNLEDIERFWTIEDIAENPSNMSTADYHCVEQYKNETYRQADGRYVVRLPMKPDTPEKLGESKQRAVAQFLQLEKKFNKNQNISDGYKSFIHEYIKLEHMYVANGDGNQTPACYLPHHCVLRADSATTALRVVFNASSPTSSGHSLNDLMYSGPNLQQDLLSLILKWRQYEIAFIADIEKMFRQILVHPEDQNLQKIIWRDSSKQLLQEYNLATVTYGTKAAPFLAMMTLKQLASDEGDKYISGAKKSLEEDFYMDDLLSGSHSITSAKQLQSVLINLLKSGGFNLRKWASNKPELLQDVETTLNQEAFDFKYPESTKTLGLRWNPVDDLFSFQIKISSAEKTLTKRALLSDISKLFDPLGWLSPVTTKLKLLFQKVWLHDVKWDSKLPDEFISEWNNIRDELESINQIRVKRWLETHESGEIELHGFCDASTKAYACVIYCKVNKLDHDGRPQSSVIIEAAKARLVPLKKSITLPRLELMACLLLSKLTEKVIQSLPKHTIRIFAWTDSTAALGWLQGDSGRWKAFVANRVDQIKSVIPSKCWHYVKSTENPADCASRGITVKQLINHSLWWTGPAWLSTYNSNEEKEQPVYTTEQELKKSVQSNVGTISQDDVIGDIVNKHSSFARVTRVLAWVLRAVSRYRPKQSFLSSNELSAAKQKIIQHNQQMEFVSEINKLKNQEKIENKSKILVETERDAKTRWQLTQKIFNDIWKRWQTEYLSQLSARSKWQHQQQNQKVGDIVIIHDANLPAGKWPLGKVVDVHPGRDGHVRVASVKTKNGIKQKPITKLSALPVNEEMKPDSNQSPGNLNQKPNQTTRKQKHVTSSLKVMAIALLTMLLVLPAQCAYNIAQLNSNQSIYFDKISDMHVAQGEWKLVVYYNMNPYWEGAETLAKCLDSIGNICIKKDKPVLCDVIMLQLRHGYNELDLYNHMLLGQQFDAVHTRARRGLINGIGNVARTLFGVLDDQFAEQYQKDIELLRMNQKHMALLWRNQTSIVEAQHNLLQRTENTIQLQHKYINKHINNIEQNINQLKDNIQNTENSNSLALSAIVANTILQNLRSIQDYLLDTIVDLHYGSFNIHLISPEQLRDELNIISGQLAKDLSLPINNISEDLPKLYHMLKVKAKMSTEFFIFEIKIPLVAREYYEIYRLLPIPHNINSTMINIIPISEYIAMNIHKDSYFIMTQADILRCDKYDDVTQLCPLQRPVYHMTSDKSLCVMSDVTRQCAINTELCKTTWSELNAENKYLYSCCGQCTVRIICGSQVTSVQLNENGIISLSNDCIIKSANFTIYSHRRQSNTLNVEADVLRIDIPPINHIIDLPIAAINQTSIADQIKFDNHTYFHQQLDEIGRQIKYMKESGADTILNDNPSSHDITQYGLISTIAGITICMSLALLWRRLRTCPMRTSSNISAPAPRAAPPPSRPAPTRPAAEAAAPATLTHEPLSARRFNSAARASNLNTSVINLSDGSDYEMTNLRYATLINKTKSSSYRK